MAEAWDLAARSPSELEAYVRERGVWAGPPPTVETLAGGVSGTVIRMDGPDRSLVLKQALPRLDVPDPWLADPRRILTEAAALATLRALMPGHVPPVIDLDAERLVVVMEAAPVSWTTWKEQLLDGQAEPTARTMAASLGTCTRDWHHASTLQDWPVAAGDPASFADTTDFTALRVDPFYRRLARTQPDPLGARIRDLADGLLTAPTALVHGDLSPKNILRPPADDTAWWLVDSECAALSDPVFDVAFVLAHLLLKSLDPDRRHLELAVQDFWSAYTGSSSPPFTEEHLVAHVCVLLLARVDGISRVHYLSAEQADHVRTEARAALHARDDALTALIERLHPEGGAR